METTTEMCSNMREHWTSYVRRLSLLSLLDIRVSILTKQETYFTRQIVFSKCPKVIKVLSLPLMPKGGSIEPLRKPLSHQNFAMKFAPYMYAL